MENNNTLSMKCEMRAGDGYVESSAEYILPDYNPDLRKLLYTWCEVKPAGKFSSDEQVDFSGVVEYRCIYADKDGEMSEVSFTSDYEYSVNLTGEAQDADSIPTVQNYQIRVLGPRKISAKASLACENIHSLDKCRNDGAIAHGEDIELERKNVRCGRLRTVESEERELAEEMLRLDGVALDEISVVSAMAECGASEFSRDGGEGRCKSEFLVKLIYRDPVGQVIPFEYTLTGEGVIPLDGIPDGAQVVCTPRVLSERFECLPTDDGVNMVANLIVKWEAVCVYNDEHSVVTDAYSTEYALDNKYATLSLVNYGAPLRERLSVEGKAPCDLAECGKIKEVLLMGARAKIVEKKMDAGELSVSLEFKIQGVISCYDANESITYAPIKFSDVTTKKVNISSQKCDNFSAIVRVSAVNTSYKIDDADIRYILIAYLDVIPCSEVQTKILESASRNENEKIEKCSGRVTVYYTEPTDTLFSVAKRYHTAISTLLENNEIASPTVGGEEKISLPKRIIVY